MKTFMEAVKEFDEAQLDKKIKIERHVNYEDWVLIPQQHEHATIPLEAMLSISPICGVILRCNSSGCKRSGSIIIYLEFLNGSTYKLYESNYYDDRRFSKTTLDNSEFLLAEADKFVKWANQEYLPLTMPNQDKTIKLGKALGFTYWISKPGSLGLNYDHTYFVRNDWGLDYVVDVNDPNVLYIYNDLKGTLIYLNNGQATPNLNFLLGKEIKVIIDTNDITVKDIADHFNRRYNTEFEDIGNNTIRNNLYDAIQGLRK